MNILFIGKACPLETANSILQKSGQNPGFQIIKFMDLILKGLCYHQQKITILSNISNPKEMCSFSKAESKDSILYHYLPSIRIPVLSQIIQLIYSFIYTIYWCFKTKGEKIIFCDIFAICSSKGATAAARLFNIRKCAMITDMISTPITTAYNTSKIWWRLFFKLRQKYQTKILKQYDLFVYLTKYMNEVYNPSQKPYIIMEGSVDVNFTPNQGIKKDNRRIIMYAGSIEAEYGFKELVEAFTSLTIPNIELHIYGNGKFVSSLIEYQKKDTRIRYMGIVSNEEILHAEQRATLMVNPRLSHQEFTKYSFPSKTSEYMLSGTPLLTTKLPGIPEEYMPFIYTFDEESVQGFANTMHKILSYSDKELQDKGQQAQQFVLSNKNNYIQSKRIIDFIISHRS